MMQGENDLQASAKLDQMNWRILELEAMLQAATASIETMSDRASTAGKSRKSDKDRNEAMLKRFGISTFLGTTVRGQGSSGLAAGGLFGSATGPTGTSKRTSRSRRK